MVRRLVDGSPKRPRPHPRSGGGGAEGASPPSRVLRDGRAARARYTRSTGARYGFDDMLFTPTERRHRPQRGARRIGGPCGSSIAPTRSRCSPRRPTGCEEQLPPGGDRLSLLKGNNGVGEEIWRDGRIVALSDWELAADRRPRPRLGLLPGPAVAPRRSTTPWRTTPSTPASPSTADGWPGRWCGSASRPP